MLTGAVVYPVALALAAILAWHTLARGRPPREAAARGVLTLYAGWILSMTLFPVPLDQAFRSDPAEPSLAGWSIRPLSTITRQTEHAADWPQTRQLGGNVLVFLPLGVLLPVAMPRLHRLSRVALAGLFFSLAIESTQLGLSTVLGYTFRVADVDDVLLNVLGVVAGYGVYRSMDVIRGLRPPGAHGR